MQRVKVSLCLNSLGLLLWAGSLYSFLLKTRWVRGYSPASPSLVVIELVSVLAGAAAQFFFVSAVLSPTFLPLIHSVFHRGAKTSSVINPGTDLEDDELQLDQHGGATVVLVNEGNGAVVRRNRQPSGGKAVPPARRSAVSNSYHRLMATNALSPQVLFAIVLAEVMLIHLVIHYTIPSKHRQSQEIVTALVRVPIDCFFAISSLVALCVKSARVYSLKIVMSKNTRYILLVILTLCTLRVVLWIAQWSFYVLGNETIPLLRSGILGQEIDPCRAQGLQLSPTLARSWVWPALTHRRLFNFFTGSESCRVSNKPSLGFVDIRREKLIVSSKCPDYSLPAIYLERPENNELNGGDNFFLPEVVAGNKEYHRYLEKMYGTDELAKSAGVIVRRDEKTNTIKSVQLNSSKLKSTNRIPRSEEEADARDTFPAYRVFEIALGRSAAYIVRCEKDSIEEMFMYPIKQARDAEADMNTPTAHNASSRPEPAGNVFILLFDALSRQSVTRTLPKFTAWMRKFRENGRTGHLAVEPQAQTTLGFSTAGNVCPYLTGTTARAMNLKHEIRPEVDLVNRSLFSLAKAVHGNNISTAFTSGFCSDALETLLGNTRPNSGSGGRAPGIDYYLYQPFCHLEYSGLESNFHGPYSIIRRCIDGRHVHEHILDYSYYLVHKQMTPLRLRGKAKEQAKFFFDISYLIDAHEGTHGAITLVDEGLTDFMERLDTTLRFFDNPLNTFIFLSDHGNHMGHYFEYTNAGQFERTTPASIFLIHPKVMERIDARKGDNLGTAEKNFRGRMEHLSTPLDVFMTLGDILATDAKPFEAFQKARIPPKSLFEARSTHDAPTCHDFFTTSSTFPCSLDYCATKRK